MNMKWNAKIAEILGIFALQLLVGWAITRWVLQAPWELRAFLTDPAMVAFWSAYLVVQLVILWVRKGRKRP